MPDSCTTCFQPCLGAGHSVGPIVPRVFHTGPQLMEALSKASGAETAVGEGDKRRAEPGAGSCYVRAPLPSFGSVGKLVIKQAEGIKYLVS